MKHSKLGWKFHLYWVVPVVIVADLVAIPFVAPGRMPARAAAPAAEEAGSTTSTTLGSIVGTFPLTGQPARDLAKLDRPALSIKIDNDGAALPQSGLNDADIVTEELVEGGLTRLMATFQSQDATVVGPIRSARPEDPALLRELGGGLFAFSGASAGVLGDVEANSGAVLLQPTQSWYRDGSHPAPDNLFSSTHELYAQAPAGVVATPSGREAPPALFSYSTTPASTGVTVRQVDATFSGSASATWTWDPAAQAYLRTQDGRPDVLAGGAPVSSINVVILSVAVTASGNYDVLHHATPLEVLIGSGPCWVLRDGVMIAGEWQRSGIGTAMTLADSGGAPIPLAPGRTWIELLPQPYTPAF